MARIIPAFEQWFDSAGDPVVAGKLFFYASGTTSPKDTFFDVSESDNSKNTNPVILNGDGRCPNVFGTGSYRVILTDKNSVQILVRDPVGGLGEQEFGADWNALITYQIGDIVRDGSYYYQGKTANNIGNRPSVDEDVNWSTWPPNTEDALIYRNEAEGFRNEAEVFRDEAAASAAAAAISEANAAASAAAASNSADEAAESAALAIASANFKGEWSSLSGPLNVPASVIHDDLYWMLLNNLPNVALSEPGVDEANWAELSAGGGGAWQAPIAANFEPAKGKSYTVNISGGSVTATLPATIAAGDVFTLHAYGSSDNSLLLDRNGHTIGYRGQNIDPDGDGNLIIENGSTATLVALSATQLELV